MNDGGHDVTWLLTNAAGGAWQFAVSVQSHLEDAEAAHVAGDWPLCVESWLLTLLSVRYCDNVLGGWVGPASPVERHLDVALDDSPISDDLRRLPPSVAAAEADAQRARDLTMPHVRRLQVRLPVDVPVLRSAGGFFPTVRLGADIEKLRKQNDLPPLDWYQWDF